MDETDSMAEIKNEKISKLPVHRCVRVANLRKHGYASLREWLEQSDRNLYVGRSGRIFIDKQIFHYPGRLYPGLKWKNPFKVGKDYHSLSHSIELYKQHLVDSGMLKEVGELAQYKELGCFCPEHAPCHAKVLIEALAHSIAVKNRL